MTAVFFAFFAGLLSILSPCVLPLVPLVLGAAASKGKMGPLWLAAGLALSFVTIGLFVALAGFAIGLDQGFFRHLGAVVLMAVGAALLLPALQNRLATATGPVGDWANQKMAAEWMQGASGQFGIGALLGIVWSPCVGPTLGAASLLASQGKDLLHVVLTMLAFGIGAAVPMLVLGTLSREAMQRWRGSLLGGASVTKKIMGWVMVVLAVLIFAGLDRKLEAKLVEASPEWLTRLTTSF